jgi:Dynein heavy chain C-terminal domain
MKNCKLSLSCRPKNDYYGFTFRIERPPDDGVFVYGLFIEGARWDDVENSVVEQLPKVVINDFPLIHFVVSLTEILI